MRIVFHLVCSLLFCASAWADQANGKMEIHAVAEHVFVHTSYKMQPEYGLIASNGLVIFIGEDAYIVDSPWPEADTPALLEWIEAQGYTPKALLSTHFHEDRTAGIAEFRQRGIATYASARTLAELATHGGVAAEHSIEEDRFSLVPGQIEVYYPGPGHTVDNLVVWLPKQQVLFGGCLVKNLRSRGMGNIADADLTAWPGSVQSVLDEFQDIKLVVPGHGREGDARLLTHTIELVETALAAAADRGE